MSSDVRSPRCGAALALLAALTVACAVCLLAVYLAPLPLRAGVALASAAATAVLCAAVTTAAYHALTSRRLREELRALAEGPPPHTEGSLPRVPRQRSAGSVDLVSLVVSTGDPEPQTPAAHATFLRACRAPVAVAEVAARLRLPVGRVRALVGELLDDGRVAVRNPVVAAAGERPGPELLARVLDGLRAL